MELIFTLVTHPELAFQRIAEDSALRKRSRFMLASAWLSILISLLLTFRHRPCLISFLLLLLGGYVALIVVIDMKSMWIHFVSENMGGEGKIMTLFSLLTYSVIPFHLSLPFSLILQCTPARFIFLMWFCLILWTAILVFKAIRIHYGITFKKTWAVILTPLFLFAGAMMLVSLVLAFFSASH